MEKLLKLLNEYEESRWETISEETDNETEDYYDEENPLWKEYQGHLRHCNANTVAFEKDTFDAYALSKKYGFIKWLVDNQKLIDHEAVFNPIDGKAIYMGNYVIPTINQSLTDSIVAYAAVCTNPIKFIKDILS